MTVPMNRVLGGVSITVLWVLLFGEVTVANVLGGAVVGTAVMLAFRPRERAPRHRLSPWAALMLLANLAVALVVSSTRVALAVIRPTRDRLRTQVVRVPLTTDSELVGTVVADLITLTPGTLTLDVRHDPERLIVHALGAPDPDEVRASVGDLERRVLRTIRPEPATAERHPTETEGGPR
jgi:multicomponent Na+:H+ antiporter subunit E